MYDDIEGIDEVELTGIAVAGSANTDSNGTPTSMTSSPTHMSPLLQQPMMQSVVNSMSVDMPNATVPTSEEKKKEKLSQSTPVTTSTSNSISSVRILHKIIYYSRILIFSGKYTFFLENIAIE